MKIKLGTVAPIGFDDFPPKEWLSCMRKLGCEVVQAYRNQKAQIPVQKMREVLALGEMPCDSLHGVFGEEFDPSSPDKRARRFAVDIFKAEGDLVLMLGGSLVVVHCSTIRHEGVSEEERNKRISQLKKSIVELGEFGKEIGVTYAFENLPGYHPVGSDITELVAILEELGAPSTGMCFDSGHANMVGNPVEAVGQTADQMIYMHFSDNSSEGDEHLMPTYGSIDTDALAKAICDINYNGTMMLEVFYSADELKKMIDEGCAERLAKVISIANGQM